MIVKALSTSTEKAEYLDFFRGGECDRLERPLLPLCGSVMAERASAICEGACVPEFWSGVPEHMSF
jgi:hypothetical protein